jgi:hypothetical protein
MMYVAYALLILAHLYIVWLIYQAYLIDSNRIGRRRRKRRTRRTRRY